MKVQLLRFSSGKESTLGLWYDMTDGRKFVCFTLEDERRKIKVKNETRIPAGRYRLKKWDNPDSRFNNKAAQIFGDMHKGFCIEIAGVPNFGAVLIHWGNTDKDTSGCVLVGNSAEENVTKRGFIGSSRDAYKRVYPPIAKALEADEDVWLSIIDGA